MAAPVVILVQPQLGENIGAAARAMLNCGLTELRLVAPRQGKINARAYAMASGADSVLDHATIFPDLKSAIADLHWVYATTARPREMIKPVYEPRAAVGAMRDQLEAGERVGVLFGPERTGLESDDVSLAQFIISAPLNPRFSSLNLAQAVLIVAWEWLSFGSAVEVAPRLTSEQRLATREEMTGLFEHLEAELDAAGYFANIEHKRGAMMRNLRNSLQRAAFLEQDVRTLRGIVKALANGRPRTKRRPRGWKPPPGASGE
jgi:tRNA/rRNA methyltransferase